MCDCPDSVATCAMDGRDEASQGRLRRNTQEPNRDGMGKSYRIIETWVYGIMNGYVEVYMIYIYIHNYTYIYMYIYYIYTYFFTYS